MDEYFRNPLQYCFICREKSKYVCPKCKIDYCSIKCYQHSSHQNCTESFYKKCVLDECSIDDKSEIEEKVLWDYYKLFSKEMFAEIGDEGNYRDLEEQVDNVSPEDPDLEERMKNINLDNYDQIWNCLTTKEKQHFEKILINNEPWLTSLIPMWQPWWHKKISPKFVKNMEENINNLFDAPYSIPFLWSPTLQFIKRMETNINKASPLIINNMVNLIINYSYMTRLYNGCHSECPLQAIQTFLSICPILCANINCQSISESVYLSLDQIIQAESLEIDKNLSKQLDHIQTKNSSADSFKIIKSDDTPRKNESNTNHNNVIENFVSLYLPDTITIINGPFKKKFGKITEINSESNITKHAVTLYLEAALSDLINLFKNGKKLLRHTASDDVKDSLRARCHKVVEFSESHTKIFDAKGSLALDSLDYLSFQKSIKKLQFYIIWILKNGSNITSCYIDHCSTQLQQEIENLKLNYKNQKLLQSIIEDNLSNFKHNNSPLI
ncbi:uncharacterized protein LOC135930238 [Gordionus sp. m RMFG-2023]|uniref:uncharacterized protein LOC135930238 n=1 Tax=Gordionus sp. m RMFG-2023 TaxID=3053472 RepID=UPI0031FE3B32